MHCHMPSAKRPFGPPVRDAPPLLPPLAPPRPLKLEPRALPPRDERSRNMVGWFSQVTLFFGPLTVHMAFSTTREIVDCECAPIVVPTTRHFGGWIDVIGLQEPTSNQVPHSLRPCYILPFEYTCISQHKGTEIRLVLPNAKDGRRAVLSYSYLEAGPQFRKTL